MAEARRTFGPVVLVGLASAALLAVAATKPWVGGSAGDSASTRIDTSSAMATTLSLDAVTESPLAAALALVVLACWGVLLVTRGRLRRAVAVLAAVAAAGVVVTAALAPGDLQAALADALASASGSDAVQVHLTGWYAAALVGAVLTFLAALAAVRWCPTWPEMGRRYDAPTAEAAVAAEPTGNLDMWRALDEGHDPTRGGRPLD